MSFSRRGRTPGGAARAAVAASLVAVVTVAASPSPGACQSLYSLRGPGETNVPLPAKHRALGGTSVAGTTPGIYGNPALLGLADRATFTGTYFLDWTRTEEERGGAPAGVRKEYAGTMTNLTVLFPLPRSLVFGTGLVFDRRIDGRIEAASSIEGQTYTQSFERDGNLIRFPALLAHRGEKTHVGAGIDLVLFNAKTRWRNEFPSGSGFVSSSDLDRETLWSVDPKIGVRQTVGPRLSFGAWGSWPRELRGERFLESDDPADRSQDVKLHLEGDLAPTWSLGFEAAPHGRWRVAADWTYEAWTGRSSPRSPDELDDVHRFAVGVERVGSAGRGLKTSPVRVGFRTEALAARDGNDRRVRENVATLGSGFGFSGGSGQFDWALEYGRRGGGENEFREQFVRFGVTLTGFERWTKRRAPEEEEKE